MFYLAALIKGKIILVIPMRKLIACLFVKFFFCSLYSVIHEEYIFREEYILHTWRIYTSQISFSVKLAINYKIGHFFVTVLFILCSFYSVIHEKYIFREEYILHMWRIYTLQIPFSVELATNYKIGCFFVANTWIMISIALNYNGNVFPMI